MNLTTDPWLPVVSAAGRSENVSLRDTFARAHEIRDLALRPHERIAVMRLLLCITHAALDGPANRKESRACRDRIAPAVRKYLAKPEIGQAFNLFGDEGRFLQLPGLEPVPNKNKRRREAEVDDEGALASKLDISLASGFSSTLLDNGGGGERVFDSATLVISLLTFQNFSGESPFGVAVWAGQETRSTADKPASGGKTYSSAGPMLRDGALHTLPRGQSLLDTVHLNLLSKDDIRTKFPATGGDNWGKPVWEGMPTGWSDTDSIRNATETYLGRLTPISRAIHLSDDCQTALISNGLGYPTIPEPTVTIRAVQTKKGEEKRFPLRAETSRALWRELPSLLVRRNSGLGGALTLDNLDGRVPFDLWVGAVVPANKNKVEDVIEGVFPFQHGMPDDEVLSTALEVYSKGVDEAERIEARLRQAVRLYRVGVERVKRDSGQAFDRAVLQTLFGLKGEDRARIEKFASHVAGHYWTEVDQLSRRLKAHAFDHVDLNWSSLISAAAHLAYRNACPHETSRQMQAFIIGLKQLSEPKQETANA